MRRLFVTFLGLVTLSANTAFTHHSIAGIYDSSREVTVEGTVMQFHFVNPHPFLNIEVRKAGGAVQQWRLEMDNRYELVQIGMTAETLKQGDRVTVAGSPAREQPQSLYIRKLQRPADGFLYEQIGSTPRIRQLRSEK
jgi:hypothetical protein